MAARDAIVAPAAHLSDGCMDLLFAKKCGKGPIVSIMLGLEDGSHVKSNVIDFFHSTSQFGVTSLCCCRNFTTRRLQRSGCSLALQENV